jgi:hypothetical protein
MDGFILCYIEREDERYIENALKFAESSHLPRIEEEAFYGRQKGGRMIRQADMLT